VKAIRRNFCSRRNFFS